tara:strand:- start:119 stop:283 length:165 start_codon:yes stop_codon:yes gene_type:complete
MRYPKLPAVFLSSGTLTGQALGSGLSSLSFGTSLSSAGAFSTTAGLTSAFFKVS